jgi:UDP-N-acetylglucosamine enolpyruvyl transferase
MAVCEIVGGKPLMGEMHLSGVKNAALPTLLQSILGDGIVGLENVRSLMQDI